MKGLDDIAVTPKQAKALRDLKSRILDDFDIEALILYGSTARGVADVESDIDLLILSDQPLTRFKRHQITDLVFEVNLHYDTNFSTLVVDRSAWERGAISVLPLRNEILKDGILL